MTAALIVLVVLVMIAGGRLRDVLGQPLGRAWIGAGWAWMAGVVAASGAVALLPGAVAGVAGVLCLSAGGVAAVLQAGAAGRRLLEPVYRRLRAMDPIADRRRIVLDEIDAIEARREPDHPALDLGLGLGAATVTALGIAAGSATLVGLGGSLLVVPVYTGARWLGEGRSARELRLRLIPPGVDRAGASPLPDGGAGSRRSIGAPAPAGDRARLAHGSDRGVDGVPLPMSGRGVGDRAALAGRRHFVLRRVVPGVREYEIVADGELVGELVGATRRGFTASGECLGEAWDLELRRRHFRLKGVEARAVRSGSDEVGATFVGSRYARGLVTLPGGRRMRWGLIPFGVGPSSTRLVDGGTEILVYRAAFFRFLRGATRVRVAASAWELEELPRLVLLTAFLRLHLESPFRSPFRREG